MKGCEDFAVTYGSRESHLPTYSKRVDERPGSWQQGAIADHQELSVNVLRETSGKGSYRNERRFLLNETTYEKKDALGVTGIGGDELRGRYAAGDEKDPLSIRTQRNQTIALTIIDDDERRYLLQ